MLKIPAFWDMLSFEEGWLLLWQSFPGFLEVSQIYNLDIWVEKKAEA